MQHSKVLVKVLKDLAELVAEEADRNPDFANRLDMILREVAVANYGVSTKKVKSLDLDIPDVFTEYETREEGDFINWLSAYELDVLKSIIKTNAFDSTRRSYKWKDKSKVTQLILEQIKARLNRGSAFLESDR
jgi:hypothetical protein